MQLKRLMVLLSVTLLWLIAVAPHFGLAQAPEAVRKEAEARAKARAEESKAENQGDDEKKNEKPDDANGEDAVDSDPEEPTTIRRPEAPEGMSVDPSALQEQLGKDGLVRFNLEGVPWPDLLRWLADASNLSLDWQELPADTLNLRTQRPYSIEEARDVINRHLLARGFTMLKHGELLSVIKIEKLNPGLIPRVRPGDLEERMPHEFVKVSFPLDWLVAEKAVEELKPMLSPNGKLTALTSTNRLEAIDAVVNLLEIRTVLDEEQTQTGDNRVVEVFHLEHVPAGEVVALVEQILGLESTRGISGGVDDQTGRMIMQQLQQLQKNIQQNRSKAGDGGGDDEKPKLIINDRDNSIVAHAPPDKMEIIRQTVTALDTPAGRHGRSLHTKIFRLSTLDPVPLLAILNELGDFSPSTKIQADETNNSLIVHGTLVDLNAVWELVQELDGSTRNFEVIPLRRLAADEVAGTIQYLMGSEVEDNNKNTGYYSYYSYRYGRGGSSQSDEEKRPFKVDADIENNRLLLWANEVELEEVQNLLVKMGEIPAGEGSDETLRVIDLSSDEDAEQVLERIRRMWPQLAPNELQIGPDARDPSGESEPSGRAPAQAPAADEGEIPAGSDVRTTRSNADPSHPLLVAREARLEEVLREYRRQQQRQMTQRASKEPAARNEDGRREAQPTAAPATRSQAPPISIQRGPDGKLIITSPDTRALDQLEAMMADVAPPRKDYHIFHLKYPNTWAYGIELTLKDIFAEDIDGEPTLDWWGGVVNQRKSGPTRLSQRRQLKIISDADSRTILVQGATPSQLATISDLIDIYDQPTTSDPQAMRTTKFFKLQYSNAQTIADTLKAVYRDLLSTNDPALRDPSGDKENRPQNLGTTISYTYSRGGADDGDEGREEPSRITYDGLISVGVDQVSNTLVVSAIEGLMPEITEIVETLDEAAQPAGNFQVIALDPSINPTLVQARLQKLLQNQRQQTPPNGDQKNQQGTDAGLNGNANARGRRPGQD